MALVMKPVCNLPGRLGKRGSPDAYGKLSGYVTILVTNTPYERSLCLYLIDFMVGATGLEPVTSCV